MKQSAIYQRNLNRKMNSDLLGKLKEVGMTVTIPSPDELKAFQDATKPVYDEWVPKIGKDLVDEFQAAAAAAK